ncbi:unnamed protein product, partial [marine sediment metagenome]
IVETGLVAVPAGANQKKEIPIVSTRLTPGLYWVVMGFDDGTLTLNRPDTRLTSAGGTLAGGYHGHAIAAPLDNPHGAATFGSSFSLYVRVASVP